MTKKEIQKWFFHEFDETTEQYQELYYRCHQAGMSSEEFGELCWSKAKTFDSTFIHDQVYWAKILLLQYENFDYNSEKFWRACVTK